MGIDGDGTPSGTLIDPTRCTASFYEIPPDDTTPPGPTSAVCINATSILLSFSEPLDDGAADPINFRITSPDPQIAPDPVIIGADLTVYNTQVLLVTLPLTAEVQYTVSVTNANCVRCPRCIVCRWHADYERPQGCRSGTGLAQVVRVGKYSVCTLLEFGLRGKQRISIRHEFFARVDVI